MAINVQFKQRDPYAPGEKTLASALMDQVPRKDDYVCLDRDGLAYLVVEVTWFLGDEVWVYIR